MGEGGGGSRLPPPQLKKSGGRIYIWSSKLKIGDKIVQELSSRLPVTFFSEPIFGPPQGVSPSTMVPVRVEIQ